MDRVSFSINGKKYIVTQGCEPDLSLNEYIRQVACLPGTKVMCREGGCGACIVSVKTGTPPHGDKVLAVNSCLVSVLSCDGWNITTIEGLGSRTAGYHQIQSKLAEGNGTQCGYCTPGFIMSMYSLCKTKNHKITEEKIQSSFGSNICRCTGYRPICDTFRTYINDNPNINDIEDIKLASCNKTCPKSTSDNDIDNQKVNDESKDEGNTEADFANLNNMVIIHLSDGHKWYKPYSLEDIFKATTDGNYKIIAGNTGQGVYHTTNCSHNIIDITNVFELKNFTIDVNLIIGSAMTLEEVMVIFEDLSSNNENFRYLKQLNAHMSQVAHIPVRNIGTVGGNIYLKHAHREFPSDLFLLFETVGAMITLAKAPNDKITTNLVDFLNMDMNKTVIVNIMLPPLSSSNVVKTYKIMPRSQNAHAIVNAGFLLKYHHGSQNLEQAKIVYGGLSPNFVHAHKTENSLIGRNPFKDETLQMALKSLDADIQFISIIPEPDAEYKKNLAKSLYYKMILNLCPKEEIDNVYKSGGQLLEKEKWSTSVNMYYDVNKWPLSKPISKIEALVQCSGEAVFANDLPPQSGELFAAFVLADEKPGSVIEGFDATEAMKLSGVVTFYSAKDIPGQNSFTPTNAPFMTHDEEILCEKIVKYFGQPAGIIVANREFTANKAAKLVQVKYSSVSDEKPLLTIRDVLESPRKDKRVVPAKIIEPTETGDDVKQVVKGEYEFGSQYHFHMEPQTCVAIPTESGMDVYSSTQWLDHTNIAVAQCLKVPLNYVNVIVRRVGGAYGAKITRSSQIACAASLVAFLLGKTCRMILPLEINMKIMGKRLPTYSKFEVGVNEDGEIQYLKNIFYQDVGHSLNEDSITSISAVHFQNCYNSKRWHVESYSVVTDTPSNTWCRSPSSTEGVAMIEYIMEKIAFSVKKSPIDVRLRNTIKTQVKDAIAYVTAAANYESRLQDITEYNTLNRWIKRGISVQPLAVNLFYLGSYNAIVSIYHGDGSVTIIHGGIEMGQGLNTKAVQTCAYKLGIDINKITVKPSSSVTSPNSMTTGASTGSEAVAFSTMKACEEILRRLAPVRDKMADPSWEDLIKEAYNTGVDLQAAYNFQPDDVQPYEVYAACVLEVGVDLLTGNYDIRRVQLFEDFGLSISPKIDLGQVQGAFVMGLGYWTSEKIIYDPKTGELLTNRTWTYKPPGMMDIPDNMTVLFREANNEFGVLQSKASGEPALCLAVAVTHALRQAVASGRSDAGHIEFTNIENPCSVENVFQAAENKIDDYKLKQ